MNRLSIITLLLILSSVPAYCQNHILVGLIGGGSYGNLFLGPQIELESPIIKSHLEIDCRELFSPIESHISLGHGYTNTTGCGPKIWINHNWGIDSYIDGSLYSVTKVSKKDAYAFGGLAWRGVYDQAPMTITIDYFKQLDNHIDKKGVETSHLQGGEFRWEVTIACSKRVCYRTTLELSSGHLLQQGNPVCDGSGYDNPQHLPRCPRTSSVNGSGVMGFLIEF